jgi:hypothetical protein
MLKCRYARANAKRRNLPYEISTDDLIEVYKTQRGRCAITNLPMTHSSDNPDFSASIDRIDNDRGYIVTNVQLVCWRCNQMKSDMKTEMFNWWCKAIAKD